MKRGMAALGVFGMFSCGCWVRSLHPLSLASEPLFESGLVGSWQDREKKTTFIAEKGGKGEYRIVYVNGDKPALFVGKLARVGGRLYLDMEIATPASQNDLYDCSFVGTHSIFRLDLRTNSVRYSYIKYKWLEDGLKAGKLSLPHETLEENAGIVITASTVQLRDFLAKHADDEGIFSEPAELKRIR